MLELLVTLIVIVLVAGVCYWAITAIAGAFGLPPQIVVVLQVLLALIVIFVLISYCLPLAHLPVAHR